MTDFTNTNRSPVIQSLPGTIQQVGASQTAIVKIPPGATYASLQLRCGIGGQLTPVGAGTAPTRAQLETMLTQFRLTVGGVEMWTLTGKELIAIMEYYRTGIIADTGIITIMFQRGWMKALDEMLGPDYGTYRQSSFQLEITQDATSTISNIDVFAEVEPVSEQLGRHIEYKKLTPTFSSTGVFVFDQLFRDPAAVMFCLWFEVPVIANLTNVSVVADGVYIWDAPPDIGYALGREQSPAPTPQTAKLFANVDFCRRGFSRDAVPLNMATLVLRLTFANAAPNSFPIIQEVGLDTPPIA